MIKHMAAAGSGSGKKNKSPGIGSQADRDAFVKDIKAGDPVLSMEDLQAMMRQFTAAEEGKPAKKKKKPRPGQETLERRQAESQSKDVDENIAVNIQRIMDRRANQQKTGRFKDTAGGREQRRRPK